jgi:hypothetical protein
MAFAVPTVYSATKHFQIIFFWSHDTQAHPGQCQTGALYELFFGRSLDVRRLLPLAAQYKLIVSAERVACAGEDTDCMCYNYLDAAPL